MSIVDGLYEKLTNADEARFCDDLPDEACQAAPRSFGLILISYTLTKLGDAVANPKTTLAWVMTALGSPAWMVGLLVPIRESGSMVPQLFLGSWVRGLAIRKWVWACGAIGQSVAIAGIGITCVNADGIVAGWMILGLVIAFSLSRCLCSIAAKDVLGKTIPKAKRGQLNGWSASAAGLVTVGLGAYLMAPRSGDIGSKELGLLLLAASSLWLLAAAFYARIPEQRGHTSGGRGLFAALQGLRLLTDDAAFRRFVVARALLMCSALSAPFYVALAQQTHGASGLLLGAFVAASGVASLVSAPVWGRFADISSKRVMVIAAALTASIGLLTAGVDFYVETLRGNPLFLPAAYFVLSLAHSGVRVGRKTYVVNLGSGNRRTDYVSVSNTVIGLLLLIAGSVGALTPLITTTGVIAVLAGMGFVGAILCATLPDVED